MVDSSSTSLTISEPTCRNSRQGQPPQKLAGISADYIDASERSVRAPTLASAIDDLTDGSDQRLDQFGRIDPFHVAKAIAFRRASTNHPVGYPNCGRTRRQFGRHPFAHLGPHGRNGTQIAEAKPFAFQPAFAKRRSILERATHLDAPFPEAGVGNDGQYFLVGKGGLDFQFIGAPFASAALGELGTRRMNACFARC